MMTKPESNQHSNLSLRFNLFLLILLAAALAETSAHSFRSISLY